MTNPAVILEETAARHRDRTAVVAGTQALTYGTLDLRSSQFSSLLAERGVHPGERVALSCTNGPFFPIAYYGILKAGAVVVPLNVLLKGGEVAYHLQDSGAVALVAAVGDDSLPLHLTAREAFEAVGGCRELVLMDAAEQNPSGFLSELDDQDGSRRAAERDDNDTAVILYTSGTTGRPKGAELTHANLRGNAEVSAPLFGADENRPDTHLCVLPLYHSFGQTVVMNSAVRFGGTIVTLPRFEPAAALNAFVEHGITAFAGVPTMYWGLLRALEGRPDHPGDGPPAPSLRLALAGGSAMPVELAKEFHARFGLHVREGYGLSETSPVASFAPPDTLPRPGSIGLPIPGVRMALIADDWTELDGPDAIGEIAISGPNVMKGYHGRPEATAAVIRDGWFRSGDLARRDEDGYYYIVDRAKDMIIRGGFNVYPREIEEALMTHPAISLAAVVGVPDPRHGEEVKAYVILHPGASFAPEDLVAWCRERMAAYKYPRLVEVREEFPTTSTGKILKRELR
ncbi:long-chain-fatty-acid--CoA ligase [Streptomyces spongiae]|uniref:Long-chain fatty acid--CoA ligase n=1 Tax=Streptomyces spongiae TaxID=565072 RepID=A0A5N8XHX4_9ACTN|nr:long-chain fatty acid--CoA ligase [Streptomyces spongiae]MPY59049.1 long-chain fatty acid--CoA ligase [Streptomyces spongiae]